MNFYEELKEKAISANSTLEDRVALWNWLKNHLFDKEYFSDGIFYRFEFDKEKNCIKTNDIKVTAIYEVDDDFNETDKIVEVVIEEMHNFNKNADYSFACGVDKIYNIERLFKFYCENAKYDYLDFNAVCEEISEKSGSYSEVVSAAEKTELRAESIEIEIGSFETKSRHPELFGFTKYSVFEIDEDGETTDVLYSWIEF